METLEKRGPHIFGQWTVTQVVEWEGEAFPYSLLFPELSLEQVRAALPAGIAKSGKYFTEPSMTF
jgi:hypothetical protein